MLFESSGRTGRLSSWPRLRICLAGLLVASSAVLGGGGASAVAETPQGGSNGRQAREDATRSIPYEKLPEEIQGKVKAVVQNPSLFRRVPVQVIDCDPNLYLFLVRNPEVVVNIWQVMGISRVTLDRTGPNTFKGNDAAGTTGAIRLCYSNHDTQVIYAEGAYDGPMFSQPVQAQCVLVLKAAYVQETNGHYYITNRLDAFIHVDHVGLDLIAKTFAPLVTKTIDINFRETAAFVSVVSRTAAANPQGVRRLAAKLTGLDANLRNEFARVADGVAVAQAAATATASSNPAGERPESTAKPTSKKLRR